ncbi:aminotransferase class I/II-fold pyridoxal phosphate-dependent enzyme [bacterium SCSIO 12741]|nr:aminotransferase class I/II-fold pyridoxal phosphate-dependent enzyme [bacterium SCSIO 12741]
MRIPTHIDRKLEEREEANKLRTLRTGLPGQIDFCSNDYLGLSQHPDRNKIKKQFFGAESRAGSGGSRLISGNHALYIQAETHMAAFFQSEDALLFNSGYDANLGIFSSIPQKGDTVIYDEWCHASIRDGIRLSHARSVKFKHNNLMDLRKKMEAAEGNIYIALESVYSMDGDLAPLAGVNRLAEEFGAYVILDEAHSAGLEYLDSVFEKEQQNCFIRMLGLGKAWGTHGGMILCSPEPRIT